MGNCKSIPFEFVLEQLDRLNPVVKPMFGCFAIYIGEKMVLILRKKTADDPDNGVWIATAPEHHESLMKTFPSMRSIRLFGQSHQAGKTCPMMPTTLKKVL